MRRANSFSLDPTAQVTVPSRQRIVFANRVVIKAGTSTVSAPDGKISLIRVAGIVEQIVSLKEQGKECILVTSGATGIGRKVLRAALQKKKSGGQQSLPENCAYDAACAGAGQLDLMTFYDSLFGQKDVHCSQLLLTANDLQTPDRIMNICYTVNTMLSLGIVPILNENDAVSANLGYEGVSEVPEGCFSDNDGLASLVAKQMNAQLLIILTDVNGLYTLPPHEPGSKLIHTYCPGQIDFQQGKKSTQGRGGIHAKITAAVNASKSGVPAVVIANGKNPHSINDICSGYKIGTLVTMDATLMAMDDLGSSTPSSEGRVTPKNPQAPLAIEEEVETAIREQAEAARLGGRALVQLTTEERASVLQAVAAKLIERQYEILDANARDLENAHKTNLEVPLLNRLKLTEAKIKTLADGIEGLAKMEEPVGRILSKLEVSEGLELTQKTVPIGVLLIIFESRPDSLPQIASLSLRSGNGLLLKGGREAEHSNRILHQVITEAVVEASGGKVPPGVIGLVEGRAQVAELLKLDDVIDLCIPRGSNALVKHIQSSTRIPVLGHAAGICHVYIDSEADPTKATKIAVDAKVNYPAACNAAETILFHRDSLASGIAAQVLMALRQSSVTVLGGPNAVEAGLVDRVNEAETMSKEYGNLTLCAEIVENLDEAINHIHTYGSGHTEVIVTENQATASLFLDRVDSACVFHNASSRFSDGYRFGFGAEVGISTGRIHARGPVGVEGLLTTKWVLKSKDSHTVTEFSEGPDQKVYTHRKLAF